MSLVIGISIFLPVSARDSCWSSSDMVLMLYKVEGSQFTPLQLFGSAWIPGEKRSSVSAIIRERPQAANGKEIWSPFVIVTRSNISSLLHLNTCRQRWVHHSIFCNEAFVVPFRVVRRRGLRARPWAPLQGLQAAIQQAVKSQEEKSQMPACQPPWRRWMELSISQ